MQTNTFNVNASEVVALTNKLEKLNRSAMPLAVRNTLNDVAFDVKQVTAPNEFEGRFIIRKKSFLRANSLAIKCKNTFNINEMESAYALKNDGQNLFEQEYGGNVENRTYIPQIEARGGSENKLVSKSFYLKNIKKKTITGRKELIKTAFAAKEGGFLIYDNILYQVRTITNRPRFWMKLLPIYNYVEGRSVMLPKREFIAPAAQKSEAKMNMFYDKNAKFRFEKVLKK